MEACMKINVGVSARHVHLTQEDYEKLFNEEIKETKKLNVIGQFKSNKTVKIKTESGEIDNVPVLGPFRKCSQVEISKTDSYNLKINPPVLDKVEQENGCKITIVGERGKITKNICIISVRHIHMNKKDYEKIKPNRICRVKVSTQKGGILNNVLIKQSKIIKSELHIDLDDANAHLLKTNDEVEVIN
jgi:putative phosphotransacetylase